MNREKRWLVCVVLAGLLAVVAGCGDSGGSGGSGKRQVVRREGEPDVDVVGKSDEEAMDEAIVEARKTWRRFAQALANPSENMRDFAIKRGFRVGDNPEAEHMWLDNVTFDGTQFRGTVANEPVMTKEVRLGDVVNVKPEELSDWKYVENGYLQGGYTIRVLIRNYTPEERDIFYGIAGFRI